jgi:3-oxoacyl-[acyl-carrier-protein] synthase-3
MAKAHIENVAIDGLVTVVPDNIKYFSDDVERLGMQQSQALRIKKSVGLDKRHVVRDGVTALDLAEEACKKLIEGLRKDKTDIGFLIFVTQSPDHRQPCNASILHGRLGLGMSVGAFDINLGCSGYVYGLFIAAGIINSLGQDVLLVVGDTLSTQINPLDRSAGILFGDAASATLLSKRENQHMFFDLCSDGQGFQSIIVPAGGARLPSSKITCIDTEDDDGNIRSLDDLNMVGGEVFNFAIRTEPRAIQDLLDYSGHSLEEIDKFFLHQANKYIIRTISKKLKIPSFKVPDDIISVFGNQSSASIPCVINENINPSERQLCVLSGFGVGLSWASVVCELNLRYCPPTFKWRVKDE